MWKVFISVQDMRKDMWDMCETLSQVLQRSKSFPFVLLPQIVPKRRELKKKSFQWKTIMMVNVAWIVYYKCESVCLQTQSTDILWGREKNMTFFFSSVLVSPLKEFFRTISSGIHYIREFLSIMFHNGRWGSYILSLSLIIF